MILILCFLLLAVCANGDKIALPWNKITFEDRHCLHNKDEDTFEGKYIERPCLYQGLNCVRRFLENSIGCTPKYGPAPDPYLVYDLPLEIVHANMTVVLKNAFVKGLNSGRIEEFYINNKTNILVLEVVFPSIIVDTPNTEAIYHFKGKEPVKISYFTLVEFKKVSLTLTVQNFRDRLNFKRHIYTYFSDAKPTYSVDPHVFNIEDVHINKMNQLWLEGMALSGREAFLLQGPMYFSVFMNNVICDSRPRP